MERIKTSKERGDISKTPFVANANVDRASESERQNAKNDEITSVLKITKN